MWTFCVKRMHEDNIDAAKTKAAAAEVLRSGGQTYCSEQHHQFLVSISDH